MSAPAGLKPGVAYGRRSVFLQQQHGERLAGNIAAAYNAYGFAIKLYAIIAYKLHYRLRRAGRKAAFAHKQQAGIEHAHAVHILFGRYQAHKLIFIYPGRQRP